MISTDKRIWLIKKEIKNIQNKKSVHRKFRKQICKQMNKIYNEHDDLIIQDYNDQIKQYKESLSELVFEI